MNAVVYPIERGMHRDRKLLDVAHEAPCMFSVPGVCQSGVNPSVPAHSNHQRHGRGMSSKSHDCFAPAACTACHDWYDKGPAPKDEKDAAFMRALERWVLYIWRNKLVKVA